MASSTIRYLGVSQESSFCGLETNDSPTLTGSLKKFNVLNTQAQIVTDDPLSVDGTDAREGFYSVPKYVYVDSNDNPTKRGSLTIECYLTSESNDALELLLKTRFGSVANNKSGTVTTAPTSSSNVIACSTTPSNGIFASEKGVSYISSNALTPNQYAIGLDVDDKFKQTEYYYIPSTSVVNPSNTCAIRIYGDGWAQDCLGCTLTGLTLTCDADTRVIRASLSVDVAYVIDKGTTSPADLTTVTATSPLYSLAAKSILGDVIGACLDEWSLTITFNGEAFSCGNYAVGRGPWQASSMDCVFNASIAGITQIDILREYYKSGETFPVSIPFTGNNIMAGFVIPETCFNDGSVMSVDTSKGFLRTTVNLSPSYSTLATIAFTRGDGFAD